MKNLSFICIKFETIMNRPYNALYLKYMLVVSELHHFAYHLQ